MLNSVAAVVFQITFCAEMHANDIFLFFKNYFWHQHIKTIQNIQTILNFSKKQILNFLGTRFSPRFQTVSYSYMFFFFMNFTHICYIYLAIIFQESNVHISLDAKTDSQYHPSRKSIFNYCLFFFPFGIHSKYFTF
jgi:hypothetical protein